MKYKDLKDIYEIASIDVKFKNLETLEGISEEIDGYFDFSNNQIKDFKYFPKSIGRTVIRSYNCLTNLKGLPKILNSHLNVSHNEIKSLIYSPKEIKGNCLLSNNKLISLKGNLKLVEKNLTISNNPELKNVKQQIIENQIKAKNYYTDEGVFTFQDIEEEFINFGNKLKQHSKKNFNIDFGLSI